MDALCQDTHLNSPLSTTNIKEAISNLNDHKLEYRNQSIRMLAEELKSLMDAANVPLMENYNMDIQREIKTLYQWGRNCKISSLALTNYKILWNGVLSYVPYQLTSLQNGLTSQDHIKRIKRLSDAYDSPYVINLYELREFLEGGVCASAKPLKMLSPDSLIPYPSWKIYHPLHQIKPIIIGRKTDSLHDLEIFLSQRVMIIKLDNRILLGSRNHLLLLHDLVAQRCMIQSTTILAAEYNRQNYPSEDTVIKLINIGDDLLDAYGNEAYNSLSLWESICVGEILSRKPDPATDHLKFRNQMVSAFVNSQGDSNKEDLAQFYDNRIQPLLDSSSVEITVQMHGLFRIWGHPTINEEEGVKKLQSVACRHRAMNPFIIDTIRNKWREYFSLSYYSKNKRYPSLIIKRTAPDSLLIKSLRDGIMVSPKMVGYNLKDWQYITFQKTFEIPEKFELSELIADKALSLNLEELKESCKKGNIGPSYKRNVILKWLETSYNNPVEFLKKIDRLGFDVLEKVIGVHPKERELKLYARLFSLLTLEKRLYVVLTEAMIADNFFEYFPEITMNFDAVTLQTRIHANTKKLSKIRPEKLEASLRDSTVIVNMDFNKWNSYMREEETKGIFTDFDNLFGLSSVISRTHEMFKDSLLYLADGTFTPFSRTGTEVDSSCSWRGHLGGLEGLRQKGWTIFTVVILKYVAEIQGVRCQIMGQGDNQVMILEYPHSDAESLKIRHERFISAMNAILQLIGPPLKIEETWTSSYFFIYGKFSVYMGLPQSSTLKRMARMTRLTNEGFQNLESTLSSISANASAATASDYDPILPYIMGSFETLGAIKLHLVCPFYSRSPLKISNRSFLRLPAQGMSTKTYINFSSYDLGSINEIKPWILIGLALQPCILGGFPTLQLCDLVNHGFPDPLSLNLWSLKYLHSRLPTNSSNLKRVIKNISNPIYNSEVSPEMISQDPVALNLMHASSGNEKIKRMVFEFMTTKLMAKNQVFLTFLQLAKGRQTELADSLFTMNPLNPRVANSIISSTIVGRALKIVSKVNKTGTMIGMMLKAKKSLCEEEQGELSEELGFSPGFNLFQKDTSTLFGQFEMNYLLSCLYQLCQLRGEFTDDEFRNCSTLRAARMRNDSWKKEITGVTVCVPQECFQLCSSNGDPCLDQTHPNPEAGYILLRHVIPLSQFLQYNYNPLSLGLGPYKPFFGSNTKNKVKYEGGELKMVAPPILRGILDCICLIGWGTQNSSELTKLLKAILASFTDLDSDWVIPDISSISGSVEHRWQDMRTSHYSSLSILYNMLTHITVNTNNFTPANLHQNISTDNFNINFQTIFTWIGCIWSSILMVGEVYHTSYHLHVRCSDCIQPIYEGMLEIDPCPQVIESLKTNALTDNPYCWIPKEILLGNRKSLINKLWPQVPVEESSPPSILNQALAAYYLDSFPLKMTENLYSFKSLESQDMIPVSVVFSINLVELMENLVGFSFLSYLFYRAPAMLHRANRGLTTILREVSDSLSNLDSTWFNGLISLLLNYEQMIQLHKSYPGLTFPKGTPPSLKEKTNFFKSTFRLILSKFHNPQKIQQWTEGLIQGKISYLTNQIVFNPILWKVVQSLVSNDSDIQTRALKQMAALRQMFLKTYHSSIINSNTNLFLLCGETELESGLSSAQSGLEKIQRDLLKNHGFCYAGVIDKVAKTLDGRRMKLNEKKTIESIADPYDNVRIQWNSLPIGCHILFKHERFDKVSSDHLELTPTVIEVDNRSYYNHFLKTDSFLTTASYKILSVLVHLKDCLDIARSNPKLSAAFGDGLAGYTQMLGRLLEHEKLYYNSLYEADKLSSTGVDDFIPAAIASFPSILNRVINMNHIVESVSDLTDPAIVDLTDGFSDKMNFILCDAEGGGWDDPTKGLLMCHHLIDIARKHKALFFVMKSYASRLDLIFSQLQLIKSFYSSVEVVRSLFSSVGNTEVFLVGRNPHKLYHDVNFKCVPSSRDPATKIIVMSGTLCHQLNWKNFKENFDITKFHETAKTISGAYSHQMRIKEWRISQEVAILDSLGLTPSPNDKVVKFPQSLIYKWRREYNLIRFSSQSLSHWKVNLLRKPVALKICYQYMLGLSMLISTDKDFLKWECILSEGYFHLYASLDASWSAALLPTKDPISPNSVVHKISELFRSQDIKMLSVEAGRLTDSIHQPIDWGYIDLDQPWQKFVKDGQTWSSINLGSVCSLPFGPIRSYSWDSSIREYVPNPLRLDLGLSSNIPSGLLIPLKQIPSNCLIPGRSHTISLTQSGTPINVERFLSELKLCRKELSINQLLRRI